ncbi:hypothetical protein QTP86_013395 [Hemibagrus guttatus]|nr:hypothetical protein QTP86_013395 [Hemibagrus guttatus]
MKNPEALTLLKTRLSVKSCLGGTLSPIKKIPVGCKSPLTLSVLSVVKQDILFGPALRGRVTPVFLSDQGGKWPSRLESFPLQMRFGRLPRRPEGELAPSPACSPEAHWSYTSPGKTVLGQTGSGRAMLGSTGPDREKLSSTEKSSVGSGAVLH